VAAVLRSADALGYGQLHIITGRGSFKRSSRTSRGSDKWLDVLIWKDSVECIQALQAQGRKVYVTDLSPSAKHVVVRSILHSSCIACCGSESHYDREGSNIMLCDVKTF
jgi:tRNA G18 (ribose-2'-O)-methylase SpoU